MSGSPPKQIEKDGVVYPSISALARDLGRSRQTVSNAITRGRLDGLGSGATLPKQIEVLGCTFPSISELARTIKVSPPTIERAMQRGELEVTVGRIVRQRYREALDALPKRESA